MKVEGDQKAGSQAVNKENEISEKVNNHAACIRLQRVWGVAWHRNYQPSRGILHVPGSCRGLGAFTSVYFTRPG